MAEKPNFTKMPRTFCKKGVDHRLQVGAHTVGIGRLGRAGQGLVARVHFVPGDAFSVEQLDQVFKGKWVNGARGGKRGNTRRHGVTLGVHQVVHKRHRFKRPQDEQGPRRVLD